MPVCQTVLATLPPALSAMPALALTGRLAPDLVALHKAEHGNLRTAGDHADEPSGGTQSRPVWRE